jgi:hypothetical protein
MSSVSQTLTGVAQTSSVGLRGAFNVALSGGVGTVQIERSFDGGTMWFPLFNGTTLLSWALNGNAASVTLSEPEDAVKYRINCTAYTSGNIVCRFGKYP